MHTHLLCIRPASLVAVLACAAIARPLPAQSVYVYDYFEGGYVDTQAGLVWGYDWSVTNSGIMLTWNGAMSIGTDSYADVIELWDADEAAVARQYDNWRMPTIGEYQDAWQKGLFDYGPGEVNFDCSPEPGLQPVDNPPANRWTSTEVGKKQAYNFNPATGRTGKTDKTKWGYGILVRSIQP